MFKALTVPVCVCVFVVLGCLAAQGRDAGRDSDSDSVVSVLVRHFNITRNRSRSDVGGAVC